MGVLLPVDEAAAIACDAAGLSRSRVTETGEPSPGWAWLTLHVESFMHDFDRDEWARDAGTCVRESTDACVSGMSRAEIMAVSAALEVWRCGAAVELLEIHAAEFAEWTPEHENDSGYTREKRKRIEEHAERVNKLLADPTELLKDHLVEALQQGLYPVGQELAERLDAEEEDE